MDAQLAIIILFTFVIHLIGTLAYAARIAGVRTRRIAVSFAIFNLLILVSRTSNSFQGPFLAKRIEVNLGPTNTPGVDMTSDFRWLLLSATAASIVGACLIPTFQRLFSNLVEHFQAHRSIPKLILHGFLQGGVLQVKDVVSLPASANVKNLRLSKEVSLQMILFNVIAIALWTVGVFAALYAGYMHPQFRLTASSLSAIINGVATVLMFAFIDPHLSMLTDDVVEGKTSEASFRRAIVWLVGTRVLGTLLAQPLLLPAAALIVKVAQRL
jgi:Alternate to MurJ